MNFTMHIVSSHTSMNYMAGQFHPCYTAPLCVGSSSSYVASKLQLPQSLNTATTPFTVMLLDTAVSSCLYSFSSLSPPSSCPFSVSASRISYGEVSFCGADDPSFSKEHSEDNEPPTRHSSSHFSRPSRCKFFLQWVLASETRRYFILAFLQSVSGRLLSCRSPQPCALQLSREKDSDVFSRRVALIVPLILTINAPLKSMATNSTITGGSGNIERSFLQNLGIGDKDIYYPRVFQGTWICNSTLVAVDTPQGEEKADAKSVEFSRKQLGYTVTYKARFIPFEKHIIGDRLFTTLSLVESTVGNNVVDHGVWNPEQPDRLTLVLRGGLKNVVTKRSSFLPAPGQFDTSEYSQQIFDNNKFDGGPPTVKASQNQTRYKWDARNEDVSFIEAFQRVSMFPVVNERLSNVDILNMDKPVTVYKYIVRFTREAEKEKVEM
ncbi:hypothetical protein KP509_09G086600 [Ceratopteris richardii]|uniref:DUF6816 domain-containing protein n=1 Tax=Ceratopteris richardii TaxID=49495 RepID=A0A8T2U316_CERRI|nr:hypothetical protein KP509_09G086600 [Ceratopteris richardii]